MTPEGRRGPVELLLLSLWALFTLVLFFTVILLAREMLQSGADPLASILPPVTAPGAAAPKEAAAPVPAAPTGAREVTLYFAEPGGRRLSPEKRMLDCGDSTLENCRAALHAIIEGPKSGLVPIMPSTAKIRGLFLLPDCELAIDFSGDVKASQSRFKSVAVEALFGYGILQTLAQPALTGGPQGPVKRVRMLFDGTPQDSFPAHVELDALTLPTQEWLAGAPDKAAP